jgi:hypothetical protein
LICNIHLPYDLVSGFRLQTHKKHTQKHTHFFGTFS